MTVAEWRKQARLRLENSGDMDADWDADWMLCEVLSCGRAQLRWKNETILSEAALERLQTWMTAREAGEPLQYVLGNTGFMNLTIRCDRRALIPRQDTETLVELALERMSGRKKLYVLDLCTGTGAIGLAVRAARPDACVTLADISGEALTLAKENACALGLNVAFRQGDLMEAVQGETFDFVLCNPPYLTEEDMKHLMREVRREPELALFGGKDGLGFYRRIASGLKDVLAQDGEALLEVGQGQHEDVVKLLRAQGYCAEVYRDLCGIERVVRAWRGNI